MKQTYILSVWCNADKYEDAQGRERTFFRFSCKKIETVINRLKDYIKQAEGYEFLYPFFFEESGKYMIEATDESNNIIFVVKQGFINELKEK